MFLEMIFCNVLFWIQAGFKFRTLRKREEKCQNDLKLKFKNWSKYSELKH